MTKYLSKAKLLLALLLCSLFIQCNGEVENLKRGVEDTANSTGLKRQKIEEERDNLTPITDITNEMIERARKGNEGIMNEGEFLAEQLEKLRRGEKVEEMIRTIFKAVALGGDSDIIRAILKRSGKLKSRLDSLLNRAGYTPLYVAAMYGHREVAKALLEAGANPNKKASNEITPISVATTNRHQELRHLLLQYGTNLGNPDNSREKKERDNLTPITDDKQNTKDNYGKTPL